MITEIDDFTTHHFDIRQDKAGFWYIWSKQDKCIIKIPKANNKRVAMVTYYGDKGTAERAAKRIIADKYDVPTD